MKRWCLILGLAGALAGAEEIVVTQDGRRVILHDNFLWSYAPAPGEKQTQESLILTKKPEMTEAFTSESGAFTLWTDPLKWSKAPQINPSAQITLRNKASSVTGYVIHEGLTFDLDTMKEVLLTNAKKLDPNPKILNVRPCVVNGTAGELVTYSMANGKIRFIFHTLILTNEKGSLQFGFYTLENMFLKIKPSMEEALAGLEY